ncbi:hypothetical protein RND71_004301 [Anisodus tanguticus]|uniref:Uncharacterized protein n=1 Tax=Anisodus tanguticus TaxID=243964 RepID=A0AAE1SYD2_9SOLA|nr:hypothetical protein RND71_004301 [Anisodus tanguticus]
MASPSDDNGDRKRAICTELEDLRHHIREIDMHLDEIILRGNIAELLGIEHRHAAYVKKEKELQDELENNYNVFYRRYL